MDVPVHANEHLLDEVFSTLPVASGSIHEIQKAVLVAIDQFVERSRFAIEKRADDSTVVEPAKVLSNCRTRRSNSRT
jgi:hypothetical protein